MSFDFWFIKIIFVFLVILTILVFVSKKSLLVKFNIDLTKQNRIFELVMAFFILVQHIIQFAIFNVLYGKIHSNLFSDLCTLIYLVIMIPLFFPKYEKFKKILFPYILVGAIITLGLGKTQFVAAFPNQITTFVESIFATVKHILLFIIGIYYFLILPKYETKEFAYVLVLPITLAAWVLIGTGLVYYITNDYRYAVYSTALFKPSTVPCDIDINNVPSNFIQTTDPDTGFNAWKDPSGLLHYEQIKVVSLWGEVNYEKPGLFIIVQKISLLFGWYYLYVTLIFYFICISFSFLIAFLSNINKQTRLIKNPTQT